MMNAPSNQQRISRQAVIVAAILALGAIGAAAILRMGPPQAADAHGEARGKDHGHGDEHGHGDAHDEVSARGPHGGQLLAEESFGAEVLIAEDGGSPRMKLWLFKQDKPLPPASAKVTATITRPDGRQQEIAFVVDKDGLKSTQTIEEPHVFEATIAIQTADEPYLFDYRMQEGRINLSDAQVKAAGIHLETAGPAQLRSTLLLPGEIRFNEDRTARLVARVPGVVEQVPAALGQSVRKGQVLAVIASATVSDQRGELEKAQRRLQLARATWEREKRLWEEKIAPRQDVEQAEQALRDAEISLQNAQQRLHAIGTSGTGAAASRFELRAPFDGMVVEKRIAVGESVKDDAAVFTLSDLATVWAGASVSARDMSKLRVGEEVLVRSAVQDDPVRGRVLAVLPLVGEQTRAAEVRVAMHNPGLAWRPGLPITVEPAQAGAPVALSVPADAVQTLGGKPSVFVRVPGGFQPVPVHLGRSDARRVEILRGLASGATIAANGSFVLKSEQGKAAAGHSH